MKRPHLHLLIDGLLALMGLPLVATGLLLAYVLPAHSRGATVWGWTRHDWGELHLWIAMAMLALLLVHLALNWGWVSSVAARLVGGSGKPGMGRRASAGLLVLTLIVGTLAGFLAAASASVVDGPRGGQGWRHGGR